MFRLLFFLASTVAISASFIIRADDDPDRYTICGADRGYTELDSLAAADYLENTIVTSDQYAIAKSDCIYAHVNTTIVSLCNGSARNRTINRDEVKRGVNQLIKDCGLNGGFTGIHVVNNLTFAAYGVFGGINMAPPAGSPPPDTPGGTTSTKRSFLVKRDCSVAFDGVSHTDCDWKNKVNSDGSCPGTTVDNGCQVFCEQRRTGLLGIETKAPGTGGNAQPAYIPLTLEDSKEVSVSNGFSIGVEGVFKEVIGAGVNYAWSVTTTTGHTVGMSSKDVDGVAPEDANFFARWVFFPKLIESCGTVSRRRLESSIPACGTSVCPPATQTCTGDTETFPNVCSLTPKLGDNGEPELYWAVRWEDKNGDPVPLDQQSPSYKTLCTKPDPDNDGSNECMNHIDPRGFNFKLQEF